MLGINIVLCLGINIVIGLGINIVVGFKEYKTLPLLTNYSTKSLQCIKKAGYSCLPLLKKTKQIPEQRFPSPTVVTHYNKL